MASQYHEQPDCLSAGDAGMLGLLSTSLSTTSSGAVPGHSLEGFKALDSSAQLALLQRLAAAKAEPKWLQASLHPYPIMQVLWIQPGLSCLLLPMLQIRL